MQNKRFPNVLIAIGALGMLLYPRLIPNSAPEWLGSDFSMGVVFGVCLGLEIWGLVLLVKRRPPSR